MHTDPDAVLAGADLDPFVIATGKNHRLIYGAIVCTERLEKMLNYYLYSPIFVF